jgi:hypothetical protein
MAELLGLGRGRGGFGGFGGGNRSVGAGDYLVTLSANGDTQQQVLRVEQSGEASEADGGFGTGSDGHPIKR